MSIVARVLRVRASLPPRRAVGVVLLAAASFHLAYEIPALACLMFIFLACLFPLMDIATARKTFYTGLLLGLLIYGPQLGFFYGVFGITAVSLWLLLALNPALFLLAARFVVRSVPKPLGLLAVPVLWTGIEYFRCELWYLRFAWLTPGLAFSQAGWMLEVGGYGISFFVLGYLAVAWMLPRKFAVPVLCAGFLGLLVATDLFAMSSGSHRKGPFVTGIQLEEASEAEVVRALDAVVRDAPLTDVFVLSEYTFATRIPEAVRAWCKEHQRYLIVGGTEPEKGDALRFTNTAFVIDPKGEIIFQQGKSVPIQFFADGLPARTQNVWDSPWGKIGICICYDLSYTRVTDELIRQGAVALIVPTMDVAAWGKHEHELHARIAPARAAEYGVPIFRLCSSGISELVDEDGWVRARAPFPGQGDRLFGYLRIGGRGRLPLDRWLAPGCTGATVGMIGAVGILRAIRRGVARNAAKRQAGSVAH